MTRDRTDPAPPTVTVTARARPRAGTVSVVVPADRGPGVPDAGTIGPPPSTAVPARRHGPSARLRIMGWLVLLLIVALVSVVLVTRNLLNNELDREISASLRQEIEEFERFAAEGRNPETGQPFTAVEQLLQVHLERQRTDESEVLAGISILVTSPPLVEGQADAVRALTEPGRIAEIRAADAHSGSLRTGQGELRWVRVPTQIGDVLGGYFLVGYLIAPERAEVNLAVRTVALVSALALLLAAGAAWVVAGQILAPVRLLHRTAVAITEDDLTRRIPLRGNDDITALAEQFNAMLDRLQTAFATQRGFLDDISHELRTPITIVRGNLELLRDDPVEQAEDRRLCLDELDRMSRMVDDLLLLAKSERPDFLRPEPTDLAELTSDIDAKIRALGQRHWRLDAIAEGTVRLDPQRITQAMIALAHNAVQHTTAGSAIALGSARQDGWLSFWITDTGPGVPARDAPTIFDRFSRGSADGVRANRAGAGLGLAIVTAIATAHGGTARLRSTPGTGATFGIDLPVEGAARRNEGSLT